MINASIILYKASQDWIVIVLGGCIRRHIYRAVKSIHWYLLYRVDELRCEDGKSLRLGGRALTKCLFSIARAWKMTR